MERDFGAEAPQPGAASLGWFVMVSGSSELMTQLQLRLTQHLFFVGDVTAHAGRAGTPCGQL